MAKGDRMRAVAREVFSVLAIEPAVQGQAGEVLHCFERTQLAEALDLAEEWKECRRALEVAVWLKPAAGGVPRQVYSCAWPEPLRSSRYEGPAASGRYEVTWAQRDGKEVCSYRLMGEAGGGCW